MGHVPGEHRLDLLPRFREQHADSCPALDGRRQDLDEGRRSDRRPGSTTGDSTFNNDQGELEADPTSGVLYDVYAAGQASIQKGTTANFNQIFVSRSLDGGQTWTASLVFSAPLNTALNNVFPAIAVDPANGDIYATWSDAHTVSVAKSTNHGQAWSAPQVVSSGGATTAVFPAIAARNGVVDLSYYGSTASSIND